MRRSLTLAVACLLLAACSPDGPPAAPNVNERVAAAAIQEFANEFGRNVVAASTVVVPGDLDLAGLRLLLTTPEVVATAPDDLETYWQILSVTEESDHWRVETASVDGAVYFSGPLFFQVIDGEPVLVEPEDVGETQITTVS